MMKCQDVYFIVSILKGKAQNEVRSFTRLEIIGTMCALNFCSLLATLQSDKVTQLHVVPLFSVCVGLIKAL